MLNLNQTREGDKVSGTYHNRNFTGTVAMIRRHTMNHRQFVVSVDLDSPIDMGNNDERDGIMLTVGGRGDSRFAWFN